MFLHSFKYAFKSLLKCRALMFWTLAFPFILATLFNLAFARLHDYEVFGAINIAVVDDDAYRENEIFKEAITSLSEGDERIFNAKYTDQDKAEQLLGDEEIDGYIYIKDDIPHVKIKQNGTNQTVITTAVSEIEQSSKMIEDIATAKITEEATSGNMPNVEQIYKDAVKTVTDSEANIRNDSREMNMMSIEFYTLIAMACMQGAMLSSEMINRCMPNISSRGKRVAIAPTKKGIVIGSNLLACYLILLFALGALIFFMKFVLGVEFGTNLALIFALAAAGGLAATMLGMCVSILFKTNDGAKNLIILCITMIGCLFAGMFGGQKGFFDNLCPVINKVSPVGMITDGFYALYYYEDSARFLSNLAGLLIVTAIFLILSIRGLRRQRYDSI